MFAAMWSSLWPWIVFGAVVAVLLTLDLAFFHRSECIAAPARVRLERPVRRRRPAR
jgi:hypothetical protein